MFVRWREGQDVYSRKTGRIATQTLLAKTRDQVMCWVLGYKHEEGIVPALKRPWTGWRDKERTHLLYNEMLNVLHGMNKVCHSSLCLEGHAMGFLKYQKHYSVLFHGVAMSKSNFNLVHFSDLFFLFLTQKKKKKRHCAVREGTAQPLILTYHMIPMK